MFQWLSNLFLLFARKLLYIFVRTTVLPEDLQQLQIDPDKPVCYVLQTRFLSNLLVLDTETRRPACRAPCAPCSRRCCARSARCSS